MTTNTIDTEIAALLAENDRRNEIMFAKFDPVTGEVSIGKRVRVSIADFAIPVQWLPVEMMDIPLVKKLVKAGSIDKFLHHLYFHHLYREPLDGYGKVGDTYSHTLTDRPLTSDRVELGKHHLIASVILCK